MKLNFRYALFPAGVTESSSRSPDKTVIENGNFWFNQIMLWVLKRIVSMRHFLSSQNTIK